MIQHIPIVIIGSGFGGLGTAIQLKRHGIEDFVIFERAGDVGGVWRDNRYPGCACDVQSHLYSFSFAPNPNWTNNFSAQPEIWAYLQRCAREFGITPHLRFHHEVRAAGWDAEARRWRIETSHGLFTANVLVAAAGSLSVPALPQLPGLEQFAGAMFHSARWDTSLDLTGKRVAVIGTGASAIQFVPAIQPQVAQLHLFQRTPPWVTPRPDRAFGWRERRLFARFPLLQRTMRGYIYGVRELFGTAFRHPRLIRPLERTARAHLASAISDPTLRAKLTPDYTIGCKRILVSNDYYPALAQPNVEVISEPIIELRPNAIVAGDGRVRPIDLLIFGTGFRITDFPFMQLVRGRDGRTMSEVWAGSPKAYLGTTVSGFPNLFILQGPNTGLGHTSVVYMLEAQMLHIVAAVRHMRQHGLAALEPRPEAQTAFVRDVDAKMRGTVWVAGGCDSWYLDRTGRNSTLWPDFTWEFRRRAIRFTPKAYQAI
ncbi:MAG: NAD(P)/FAD-dependent oxidoreductase [Roseiflexaceae bacterium]|nr:NAD(P)/FAD-dependent oxidoreductase [Roseiflexaceae bacterium]